MAAFELSLQVTDIASYSKSASSQAYIMAYMVLAAGVVFAPDSTFFIQLRAPTHRFSFRPLINPTGDFAPAAPI